MLAQGKLDTLLNRFAEIEHRMSSNPDAATYVRLSREYAEIEPLVRAVQALRKAEEELAGAEAMIEEAGSDREMRELAEAERDAQKLRGEGDAEAARIYGEAANRDPAFYAFQRSLEAYRASFADGQGVIVLDKDDPFLQYMKSDR